MFWNELHKVSLKGLWQGIYLSVRELYDYRSSFQTCIVSIIFGSKVLSNEKQNAYPLNVNSSRFQNKEIQRKKSARIFFYINWKVHWYLKMYNMNEKHKASRFFYSLNFNTLFIETHRIFWLKNIISPFPDVYPFFTLKGIVLTNKKSDNRTTTHLYIPSGLNLEQFMIRKNHS